MKTIQQYMKPNNLCLNEAIGVAQNRPLWRLTTMFACQKRRRNNYAARAFQKYYQFSTNQDQCKVTAIHTYIHTSSLFQTKSIDKIEIKSTNKSAQAAYKTLIDKNHCTILLLDTRHWSAKTTHRLWTTVSNVGSNNSNNTPVYRASCNQTFS